MKEMSRSGAVGVKNEVCGFGSWEMLLYQLILM